MRKLSVRPRFPEIRVHPFKDHPFGWWRRTLLIFRFNHVDELADEGTRCDGGDAVRVKLALENQIFNHNPMILNPFSHNALSECWKILTGLESSLLAEWRASVALFVP